MITTLMISAKMTTPGLLRVKVNLKQAVMTDVTNKTLLHYSNYNVNLAMLSKFGNINFKGIWPEKSLFLKGGLVSSLIIWDWNKAKTWNLTPEWQKCSNKKSESFGG